MGEYAIPEPSENPAGSLVIYYKVTKNVEYDDRVWDRRNFGRFMSAASDLLEILNGFENAKKCLDELGTKFTSANLDWTLETVVRHAHDWKQKRGIRNGAESRKRFFDAVAKQRASDANMEKGKLTSAGEVLSTLGNIQVIGSAMRSQNGSGDIANGKPGSGMGKADMEAEKNRRVG